VVLSDGQPLELRVFVDRSVVEVFADNRHYLAKRIYPARRDSLGVQVFALGGSATLRSLDAWQMAAIWPV
ncbi:MAG: GH32 C-terminal domain-containing protein, partial [Chloroflexi bacterium]|nr:GH32 C-terminal domain-containing protein [Chloroflexota bacterium]